METLLDPTAHEITDQQLVARLLRRDESAMDELYERYHALLAGVIMKVTHDAGECDDILQEVMLQAWDRISTYEARKGKLSSWLATVARRRAIDHVRRNCAYRRASDRFEVVSKHDCENNLNDRGTEMSSNDVRRLIDRQLNLLPDPQSQAIRLAFLEGRSQREIAALTHTALGTVKTRIELGLKKLSHAISGSRAMIL